MASLSHYNGRGRAEIYYKNQLEPVRDYSFSYTRFLSLLRHIGFPLHFRTGARAPKISGKSSIFQEIFGESVSRETLKSWHDFFLTNFRGENSTFASVIIYPVVYHCNR